MTKADVPKKATSGKKFSDYKKSSGRKVSSHLKAHQVPKNQRVSGSKSARWFSPEGAGVVTVGKKGSSKPAGIWFVSNRAKPIKGKKNLKIRVKAVSAKAAASHALTKYEGWGSNMAYVGDGTGNSLILIYARRTSQKSGRKVIMAVHSNKPFRPIHTSNKRLSSSEGSEDGVVDSTKKHKSVRKMKKNTGAKKSTAGKMSSAKKSTEKKATSGRAIAESTKENSAKRAGKAAQKAAPAGEKLIANHAAQAAVDQIVAKYMHKQTPAVAAKAATAAGTKAASLAKAEGAGPEGQAAAKEGAKKEVQKVVAKKAAYHMEMRPRKQMPKSKLATKA